MCAFFMEEVGFMKKLIFILFATFTSFNVFANDLYVGAHFAIPIESHSTQANEERKTRTMTSIGAGFHALTLYTETAGLYINADFFLPEAIEESISIGKSSRRSSSTYSSSTTYRSENDSIWGISVLAGPGFALSRTLSSMITISPGIYINMLFTDYNFSYSSYSFGIGANLQYCFALGSVAYFYAGSDFAYTFYRVINDNGKTSTSNTSMFVLTPKLGLGLRFK